MAEQYTTERLKNPVIGGLMLPLLRVITPVTAGR